MLHSVKSIDWIPAYARMTCAFVKVLDSGIRRNDVCVCEGGGF